MNTFCAAGADAQRAVAAPPASARATKIGADRARKRNILAHFDARASPVDRRRAATQPEAPIADSALEVHFHRRAQFDSEVASRDAEEGRLSMARLVLFLAAAALLTAGLSDGDGLWTALGSACALGFFVAVALHQRVASKKLGAEVRRDIHDRHLQRIDGRWTDLPGGGKGRLPPTHAYAGDIDLLGPGSLLQRIDVSQTNLGEQVLATWLGAAATREVILARQAAVEELRDRVEFRQELEAAACLAKGPDKIDGRGFAAFAHLPSTFEAKPWLRPVSIVLPILTAAGYGAGEMGVIAGSAWLLPLTAQIVLLSATSRAIKSAFDLVSARQGVVEAFERMLRLVEGTDFSAPALQALRERLQVEGKPPSAHMAELQKLASYAELRRNFLLWAFLNPLTMWDLHVLRGLEAWNAVVGKRTGDWFLALGELEALCSLATFAHGDPDATFPDIADDSAPLQAVGLSHPLLSSQVRVANDVELRGPGTALVVTGSNMAGKSTLLRAVGLNVALALAGGAVSAARMRLPVVRLRASMRAQDELQEGASYFHAELTKLRIVVEAADEAPPILFLLDELLRGTNERARHVGARSVLTHLLQRGACGLVATHDVALAALETELPEQISNVHFTDVVVDNEMRFDYRLRPGIVKTSNALRLLAMAGIEVPDDERAAMEHAPPSEQSPTEQPS